MSVTISDVASKAGVSTSTVSKVINNNPTISAETTARVNAAIKELHYIPNSRAVSFAKGQAKNIVYLSTLGKDIAYENPHMFDIMCGVYHELTSHHYMMSLVDTSEESYPGERAIVEIKKRSADGLIIHGSIVNETLAKHLLEEEIPHIIIGHPDFETRLCWIDTDHTLAGEYAADHICECGYTNVFFIAGRRNDAISNQRLKGFKKGMIHHKEYITCENIGYTNNTQEGAYEVTRTMLQKLPKPQAIVCENNLLALGVVNALRDLSFSIPDDIGLLTFDIYPYSKIITPQPTVIDINMYDIGIQAGRMMLHKLENPRLMVQSFTALPTLIQGQTTTRII